MYSDTFKILLQHILPQRTLSRFAGFLANCEIPFVKNALIRYFLKKYSVDMSAAIQPNPYDYPSFQALFTRQLKAEKRPIASGDHLLISPVDGQVRQLGSIEKNRLFQAKNFYYTLESLLANQTRWVEKFLGGRFCTLYLAPNQYHRVHMPIENALLTHAVYVPGRLFSVSQTTAENIDHLFARNERLIAYFDTPVGPLAMIFVGAMLVGQIKTNWPMSLPSRPSHIHCEDYTHAPIRFQKGDEVGHFQMGSTIILLLGNTTTMWEPGLQTSDLIQMGEKIGTLGK